MGKGVRVAVVRRFLHKDLIAELVDEHTTIERCPVFADGQEFVFDDWPTKPEGFCDMAWQAIYTGATLCWFDADLATITVPNTWIACCPDGLRPVVFTVERVDLPAGDETNS
ncbi:TIGR04076 family protein [Candidatus Bipolaricaulota bacterium]